MARPATTTSAANGAFGTSFSAPIIYASQVAILSTCAVPPTPAAESMRDVDFVAPLKIGRSSDHRAFDGAYSVAFLSRLKQSLEQRNWADELGDN